MPALDFCALRNRFFVRHFRRVQLHLDAVTLLEFLDDRLDVDLARTSEQEFLCLRIAGKGQRRIFFQNLVNRHADLLFVLARFWFDGESNCSFWILDGIVNDRLRFVADRVPRLRLFQLNAGNDVAGISFGNFFEMFSLHRMQSAQTFRGAAG